MLSTLFRTHFITRVFHVGNYNVLVPPPRFRRVGELCGDARCKYP